MERIDGKRIVNALKPGILGLLVNAAYVFTRNAIVDPVTAVIFYHIAAVFLFVSRIHPCSS
jgi:chromate transport protein ChrA